MLNRDVFDYEVSIWTLQDEFITVLKHSGTETREQVQFGNLDLKNDGTETLTFSIPMYYYIGNERVENSAWHNTINGNLIVNLRKIKVIFNKKTEIEKVFEFLITKVTEEHNNNVLTCSVECESLAFNELGKIGYQISLSEDTYKDDLDKWYKNCNNFIQQPGQTLPTTIRPSLQTGRIIQYDHGSYRIVSTNDSLDGLWSWDVNQYERITVNSSFFYKKKSGSTIYEAEAGDTISAKTLYVSSFSLFEPNIYNAVYILTPGVSLVDGYKTTEPEPKNNINYWVDKIMPYVPKWEYKIEMDWNDFYNTDTNSFQSDKIYEKAISALGPGKEKLRLLEVEESNVYNITQTIAELFEVFCRYEYEYDQNYHIKKRTIVFYNNYYNESEGAYDITYAYNTSEIKREIDSLHTITKMYVRPIEDETTPTGLIDIMDVEANKTKENYILNFDYLHEIGTISDEQYAAVSEYETNILAKNNRIIPLESAIVSLQNEKTELESQVTFYYNAASEDRKRLSDNAAEWNSKLGGPQENFEGIEVGVLNPDVAILKKIENNFETTGTELVDGSNHTFKYYHYYINVSKEGINASTIQVYRDRKYINYIIDGAQQVTTDGDDMYIPELSGWLNADCYFYNDSNDVNRINITFKKDLTNPSSNGSVGVAANQIINPESQAGRQVYLTYTYNPHLHYERLANIWSARLANDEAKHTRYSECLQTTTNNLNYLLDIRNTELAEKTALINNFNKVMGPALREGYWQPEDYTDYTDRYNSYYSFFPITNSTPSNNSPTSSGLDEFIWDTEPFEGEPVLIYKDSIEAQSEKYYPYVDLSHLNVRSIFYPATLSDNNIDLNSLCVLYYTYNTSTNDYSRLCSFQVGSKCQFAFLRTGTVDNYNYKPILILTGVADLTEDEWTAAKASPIYLGQTKGGISGAVELVTWKRNIKYAGNTLGALVEPNSNGGTIVYPRIKINSLSLTDSEIISYGGKLLKKYYDYSILIKTDTFNSDNIYAGKITEVANYNLNNYSSKTANYITIKPEILLSCGIQKNDSNNSVENLLSLTYSLSLTNKAIYYDALTIAKESAYPKTTYDVKLSIFNKDFLKTIYRRLCQIVHINDVDLHFKYIKGYISEISINLDKPWESTVEIKNHKDKFEDLFSTIVAQTEEMKKNSDTIYNVSKIIDGAGFSSSALTTALIKVDFNKAFNNGTLTISEKDGIWGTSDAGVIAFRGGGIFLADSKDANGNWQWHTGIVPQGINANLITAGQLDTNRVMIYAGDKLSFQINSEGIFAYKSFFDDANPDVNNGVSFEGKTVTEINQLLANGEDLDEAQFVKMDSGGLFLHVNKGAVVATHPLLNDGSLEYDLSKVTYITIGDNYYSYTLDETTNSYIVSSTTWPGTLMKPEGFDRVAITWDGLTLRNYNGEKVFFMDPNSGNLYIKGNIYKTDFKLVVEGGKLVPFDNYVNVGTQQIVQNIIDESQAHLLNISNKVDFLAGEFADSLNDANEALDLVGVNIQEIQQHIIDLSAEFNMALDEAEQMLTVDIDDAFDKMDTKVTNLNTTFTNTLGELNEAITAAQSHIDNIETTDMLLTHLYEQAAVPSGYKIGDTWHKAGAEGTTYIATNDTHKNDDSDANRLQDWTKISTGLENTYLDINANTGIISMGASSGIHVASGGHIHFVTSNNNGINKMLLNDNGISIASGKEIKLYTSTASSGEETANVNDNTTKNGITLGGANGIQISSSKKITFYSGTGSISASDALIELNRDRILFGVQANSSATAVNIDTTGFVVTAGSIFTSDSSSSSTSSSFSIFNNAGLQITKEHLGMSVASGSNKNLFWMDDSGFELGTYSSASDSSLGDTSVPATYIYKNKGSYVLIKRTQGVEIGTNYTNGSGNDASVVRLKPGDVRIGSLSNGDISTFNVKGNGLIFATRAEKTSDTKDTAPVAAEINPDTSLRAVSGMRIKNNSIGMSVLTSIASNSTTASGQLFLMNENGLEIGSVNINSADGSGVEALNLAAGSYVLIKRTKGVEIGSQIDSSSPSVVSVRTTGRVLIATRADSSTSVVDVQPGKIVLANGFYSTITGNFSTTDVSASSNNFDPKNLSDVGGVRITNDDIGLAIKTELANDKYKKNLIWMDKYGLEIGSIDSSKTYGTAKGSNQAVSPYAGAYVLIKEASGVTIGTGINTDSSMIALAPSGIIHAVTGTYGSNSDYAAFNLGYDDNGTISYGTAIETTGLLTLYKYDRVNSFYPLQILSGTTTVNGSSITSNQISLRHIKRGELNQLTFQIGQSNDKPITLYQNGSETFGISYGGGIYTFSGINYNTAYKNNSTLTATTTHSTEPSSETNVLYDTIKSYNVDSNNYVTKIELLGGTVLNFNRPASGISLSNVGVKIAPKTGNGDIAVLTLSATGQTPREIELGPLELSSGTASNSSYIQFNTGDYAENSGIYPAIGLLQYWNAAQSGVSLKPNSSNSTVKLSKTSGDTTVAYLVQSNNTVYLTANNDGSGNEYAELSIITPSVSHDPTFSIVNVSPAGDNPHSFKITPSCEGTDGTAIEYRMAITATFNSFSIFTISPKTSNFKRSDRITLLQNTTIVKNAYINLANYWDASRDNIRTEIDYTSPIILSGSDYSLRDSGGVLTEPTSSNETSGWYAKSGWNIYYYDLGSSKRIAVKYNKGNISSTVTTTDGEKNIYYAGYSTSNSSLRQISKLNDWDIVVARYIYVNSNPSLSAFLTIYEI